MMIQKIEKVEERESDNGKQYWRVKTNEGWFSCFDAAVATKLHEGVWYELKTKDSGNFKNIVGFGIQKENDEEPVKKSESAKTSMYVSYSKDIFIAMLEHIPFSDKVVYKEVMKEAIELVKLAHSEFY